MKVTKLQRGKGDSICNIQQAIFKCSNVQVFECSSVQMFKCSNVQMFKCSSVQMFECSVDSPKGLNSSNEYLSPLVP